MESMPEPIAIVGSSCRFPGGVDSPSKLWELLKEPRDLLSEIPASRFNPNGFYHENGEHHGSTNVRHAYLLDEDPALFDHQFFGAHPKEAESMDPQHRILLETVYEGVEAAGYSLEQLRGSQTCVFVGQMGADYYDALLRDMATIPQYLATGTARNITANRISYTFDLRGPSVTVDTACSSSLVAVHHAVQELRHGDSSMAIAAGCNLILSPDPFIIQSKLHMLSPTGRSRMWDADADGYARGEGFAAVILKTLKRALADGDHIECLIRETGVNQDGRTAGIAMPNPLSQVDLIKRTYARCGLDCGRPEDRCQFFEAHGTGTLAGDPVEAEAIRDAFFPISGEGTDRTREDDRESAKLLVGSIKTVVGHLEGTAGLAGLLKASLAIQNATIPPNLLFRRLNPAILPFYANLEVPREIAQPWPTLTRGVPRRASVNSFGFGGTNSHAILESWEPDPEARPVTAGRARDERLPILGPLVLSAASENSLLSSIASISAVLGSGSSVDADGIFRALQLHRTEFRFKASFAASTLGQLIEKLDESDQSRNITKATEVTKRFPLRILGIFTGQGAQWASMGTNLFAESAVFRASILEMESILATLPEDPPSWTLSVELLASQEQSRVHEAAVAQPLTTALQIALVDLLRSFGLQLSAVVGHSSGEIGAAYAAGFLSKQDAIKVSYYRGLSVSTAASMRSPGKMMAVGMSFDEATAFCHEPRFTGRIVVAASNSPSSMTLSGDAAAIDEAKAALDERQAFARLLKVDTAYHSHHLDSCTEQYLAALQQCNIQVREGSSSHPRWFSSVHGPNGRRKDDLEALRDQYWVDNMRKPVLFSQALARAVTEFEYCYDLVLEIGPHPALKSPATETLRSLTGKDIPYCGLLQRGADDIMSFSEALGFVWGRFISPDKPVVDFRGFTTTPGSLRGPIKGVLPPYRWDHRSRHWKESRVSRAYRTRSRPPHPLLGMLSATHGHAKDKEGSREMRWRNVFKLSEMPWVRGHQFQGEVLFPAAGYVAMAYEAAMQLVGEESQVRLVELTDMHIYRPITLDEQSVGADLTFSVRTTSVTRDCIRAEFSCYGADVDAAVEDEIAGRHNFQGRLMVTIGEPSEDILPRRIQPHLPLTKVDLGAFYTDLERVGLRYSGDFRATSVRRRLDMSSVTANRVSEPRLRLHPASLDALFHGLFAAFADPGDEQMWTYYLPTAIERVRINMECPAQSEHAEGGLIGDCRLGLGSSRVISGDVSVFCAGNGCGHAEVQIQGLTCSAFALPTAADDRKLYAHDELVRDISCGSSFPSGNHLLRPGEMELTRMCERAAHFYFRRLSQEIRHDEVLEHPAESLMNWINNHLLPEIDAGRHPHIDPADNETLATLRAWQNANPSNIDVELIMALGESFPSIIRGEIPILQVLMENNRLTRLYEMGLGFRVASIQLGQLVGQLSHRYPHMDVLEIGAGTGGATKQVLASLSGFRSYTFTDISSGFFEAAKVTFEAFSDRMDYRVLNIENDIAEGDRHRFDVIIASCVLHATHSLKATLQHCRSLLRPGGYLLLLEITNTALLRPGFIVGALAGWWLGRDDGRTLCPTVSEVQWNRLLLKTGFSGVDSTVRDIDGPLFMTSVMVSQAVDDRVQFLREPLEFVNDQAVNLPRLDELLIVGGSTSLDLAKLGHNISTMLSRFCTSGTAIERLEDVAADWKPRSLPSATAIICLVEAEDAASIFGSCLGEEVLQSLKVMFNGASYIVWGAERCRTEPFSNMIIGLARSVRSETPDLRLKIIDVESFSNPNLANRFGHEILRALALNRPEFEGILCSDETELHIADEDLITYIPRVRQSTLLNDKLNSRRRRINTTVYPSRDLLEVLAATENSCPVLRIAPRCQSSKGTEELQVLFSSTSPKTLVDGTKLHLCVGRRPCGGLAMALSPANTSKVWVAASELVQLDHFQATPGWFSLLLTTVIAETFVASICAWIRDGGVLWIHGSALLPDAMAEAGRRRGIRVFTSHSNGRLGTGTFIHPFNTAQDVEDLVPSYPVVFVDLEHPINDALHQQILQVLPSACSTFTVRDVATLPVDYEQLRGIITRMAGEIPTSYGPSYAGLKDQCISLERLAAGMTELPKPLDPTAIVNWDTDGKGLEVALGPTDTCNLFSPDGTYFLVGLTGDVGLSLLFFMQSSGARHVAVASRRPTVDAAVLRHLKRRGLNVSVFSLDISDKDALRKVHQQMLDTMPPIKGVVNAAMVLRDASFSSMSFHDFSAVLQPKVQGTMNLDELFYSNPLEFFITFSSISSVVGLAGQANYGAANMFTASLARRRKARGLAASCVDIAKLQSVGYVARSDGQFEALFEKNKFANISEPEFHRVFATAIEVGQDLQQGEAEILTGLHEAHDAPWVSNPRFAHFVSNAGEGAKERKQRNNGGPGTDPTSLQGGETSLDAMEACFKAKLALILQSQPDELDTKVSLMQLGIDSLIAVEIRSWFLKSVGVDMPVLRIIGGSSITDICKDAMARLPQLVQQEASESALLSGSITSSGSRGSGAESPTTSMASTPPFRRDATEGDTTITAAEQDFERIGPMSHAQRRLYFLHEYLADKSTYNTTFIGTIKGPLNMAKLKSAVRAVVRKHESLRCAFIVSKDGQAVQAVRGDVESAVAVEHKVAESEDGVAEEIRSLTTFEYPLHLGQGMKVVIVSCHGITHVCVGYHHLVLDGVSHLSFLKDLHRAYAGRRLGPVQQAIDMAAKQWRDLTPEKLKPELQFWKETYANAPDTLPLFPFSKVKSRRMLTAYDTEEHSFQVDAELARRVKKQASTLGITAFHFYLAALAALIARTLDVRDFSLGMMDANRQDAEDYDTIGFFLNPLPLRFRLADNPDKKSFSELARQTRDNVLGVLANSRVPFDTILDHLGVSRSGNQNPLFQIAVNWRNGFAAESKLGDDCSIHWTSAVSARNPYDLIVDFTDMPECMHISFTTQKYLYHGEDNRRLAQWYLAALDGFASHVDLPISDCPVASPYEIGQAIALGRGLDLGVQEAEWPEETIAHRIDAMAALHLGSVAIRCSQSELTYAQMMGRVNLIAALLQKATCIAKPGAFVGLLLPPSVDFACSLLAVLRLGLVYVPLDLRNPAARLASIVTDCQPAAIVSNHETLTLAESLAAEACPSAAIINVAKIVDEEDAGVVPSSRILENNLAAPDAPGFAVYTSGSTGKPKGVLLRHSSMLAQIRGICTRYGLGRETVLQQSAYSFDLSLEQLLVPLATGGVLVIAPASGRGDPLELAKLILREGITYTEMTPSEYVSLLKYGGATLKKCYSWRFAFAGGEKITAPLRSAFQKLNLQRLDLINVYGPAEACLSCTRGVVPYGEEERRDDDGEDSLAGLAMPGYSVFITDRQLRPLPVGYPGEICIGGIGTAVGYLNKPEETRDKFVELAVSDGNGYVKNYRVYKSGDRGRIRADGSLQFMGRMDGNSQVKIRGIRVELDEISEAMIQTFAPIILDAAVTLRSGDLLGAFVVLDETLLQPEEDQKTFLDRVRWGIPLPVYMIPSFIVAIDQIPRNPNGKRDQAATDRLPVPGHGEGGAVENPAMQNGQVSNLSPVEARLLEIWLEVLGTKKPITRTIDVDSDFFHVGGNSLLLIALRTKIRAEGWPHLSLPELFQASTLRSMAARIQHRSGIGPDAGLSGVPADWDEEISSVLHSLPPVVEGQHEKEPQHKQNGLSVLLTGATGFLGRHLLDALVANARVAKIHCVAIRPDSDNNNPRHAHIRSAKIFEYSGDLSARHLGLSASERQALSQELDVIIHNGADVSFLKPYSALRNANVLSVRSLIELALPRGVPLHFLSTAGVARLVPPLNETEIGVLPEEMISHHLPPADDNLDGYTISKWAAERLLEGAASERSLPVWVHRPTTIIGEDAPDNDILASLLRVSRKMQAVPALGEENGLAIKGAFDFVPAEEVAAGILESTLERFLTKGEEMGGVVKFVHHCSEEKVQPSQLGGYLERADGVGYRRVPMQEWMEQAREMGLSESVYGYLKLALEGGKAVVLPAVRKCKS